MPNYRFEVGDKVRIRDFWEMYAEYGCDSAGDITLPGGVFFCQEMKFLCGEIGTINSTSVFSDVTFFDLDLYDCGGWSITSEMLQPA